MHIQTLTRGMLGALLLSSLALAPAVAFAQQSAPSIWFDGVKRTPADQLFLLQEATAQQTARQGGYGPGQSTTNVYGDVNTTNTYNGPSSSSTAYNSGQSNTTNTTIGAGSSDVNVTVDTSQVHTGDTNQNADSTTQTGSNVVRMCGSHAC